MKKLGITLLAAAFSLPLLAQTPQTGNAPATTQTQTAPATKHKTKKARRHHKKTTTTSSQTPAPQK